jgi:hypothetical protein
MTFLGQYSLGHRGEVTRLRPGWPGQRAADAIPGGALSPPRVGGSTLTKEKYELPYAGVFPEVRFVFVPQMTFVTPKLKISNPMSTIRRSSLSPPPERS